MVDSQTDSVAGGGQSVFVNTVVWGPVGFGSPTVVAGTDRVQVEFRTALAVMGRVTSDLRLTGLQADVPFPPQEFWNDLSWGADLLAELAGCRTEQAKPVVVRRRMTADRLRSDRAVVVAIAQQTGAGAGEALVGLGTDAERARRDLLTYMAYHMADDLVNAGITDLPDWDDPSAIASWFDALGDRTDQVTSTLIPATVAVPAPGFETAGSSDRPAGHQMPMPATQISSRLAIRQVSFDAGNRQIVAGRDAGEADWRVLMVIAARWATSSIQGPHQFVASHPIPDGWADPQAVARWLDAAQASGLGLSIKTVEVVLDSPVGPDEDVLLVAVVETGISDTGTGIRAAAGITWGEVDRKTAGLIADMLPEDHLMAPLEPGAGHDEQVAWIARACEQYGFSVDTGDVVLAPVDMQGWGEDRQEDVPGQVALSDDTMSPALEATGDSALPSVSETDPGKRTDNAESLAGPGETVAGMPKIWENLTGGPVPDLVSGIFPPFPTQSAFPDIDGSVGGEEWEEAVQAWRDDVTSIAVTVANIGAIAERLELVEGQRDQLAKLLDDWPQGLETITDPGAGQRAYVVREAAALDAVDTGDGSAVTTAARTGMSLASSVRLRAELACELITFDTAGLTLARRHLTAVQQRSLAEILTAHRQQVSVRDDDGTLLFDGDSATAHRALPGGVWDAHTADGNRSLLIVGADPCHRDTSISGLFALDRDSLDSLDEIMALRAAAIHARQVPAASMPVLSNALKAPARASAVSGADGIGVVTIPRRSAPISM